MEIPGDKECQVDQKLGGIPELYKIQMELD